MDILDRIHVIGHCCVDAGLRRDICLVAESMRAQFVDGQKALFPFPTDVDLMFQPCPVVGPILIRFRPDQVCLSPIAIYQVEDVETQVNKP